MYGVFLVLILVIMGGAIAYIGDKLGTKVGKRKMSIFGLRPKHTSIIVTIITGILITASTLGVMALTSQNVRVALFGMEKLNQQIHETKENLDRITLSLEEVNKQREATQAELEQVQRDYKAASVDLDQSHVQIEALEQMKLSLEGAKAQLEQKVQSLGEEQNVLEGDIQRLNVLALRLNQGLQFVREGEIVFRAGEAIVSAVAPQSAQQSENGEALRNIMMQANRLVLDRLGVKEDFEVLWVSKAEFEQAVTALTAGKGEKVIRLTAAGNIVYGEPVRVQIGIYPNQLIYEQGQLIYRETYKVNMAETEAEQIILGFLKNVNTAAIKEGILPDPLRGTVGAMSGAQFYDIVNDLEQQNGAVVIEAHAAQDTHAAGPLRLNIEVKVK